MMIRLTHKNIGLTTTADAEEGKVPSGSDLTIELFAPGATTTNGGRVDYWSNGGAGGAYDAIWNAIVRKLENIHGVGLYRQGRIESSREAGIGAVVYADNGMFTYRFDVTAA